MAQSSPAADALETWLVAESCRLKDLGNAAAGISDHSEAVRLYSASLEADQSNLKARNNRAQMLLSLSRYEECVQDVVEVLKFEPDNVKAIFRAGQAYEGLNRLQDAEDMYSRVLAIDSRHVSAINLKNKLHDKIKANRPTQSLTPTAKELSKAPKVSGEIKSKISITGASELKDSHTSLTESKELPVRAERIESKVARKVQGMTLKPEVPDVPPTTVYELERVWRGLRGRADLFAKYLCIFKKVTFKKVDIVC
jgi:tetratricopeptide (TPR) repeat protein